MNYIRYYKLIILNYFYYPEHLKKKLVLHYLNTSFDSDTSYKTFYLDSVIPLRSLDKAYFFYKK